MVWPRFSPKFWIEVHKVVNSKVVDLTTLYNFYKGSRVFSQWILHNLLPNFECRHVSVNRTCWQLTTFFILLHPKFEMPTYMKVVSLDKRTTFILVDFEVFSWNLENAAKVMEDTHRRQCLSGGWPCLWPRVDHKGVLTWSRGSIGFVGEVFEVMTQVDLGLTNISQFDLADPAISVNNAN
jgi:hypothetical protein